MEELLNETLKEIKKNQQNLKKDISDVEKILIKHQNEIEDFLEIDKKFIDLQQKFYELSIKMEHIQIKTSNAESAWTNTIDFIVKMFWVILVSYLLYKLGIPASPV